MRLWHESLIPFLPRQQLLGQHRECCALRGNSWGKKHSVVDYVFKYNPYYLAAYHLQAISEMVSRGYDPDRIWLNPSYRGEICNAYPTVDIQCWKKEFMNVLREMVYPEHDAAYLRECLDNLAGKGIHLDSVMKEAG